MHAKSRIYTHDNYAFFTDDSRIPTPRYIAPYVLMITAEIWESTIMSHYNMLEVRLLLIK